TWLEGSNGERWIATSARRSRFRARKPGGRSGQRPIHVGSLSRRRRPAAAGARLCHAQATEAAAASGRPGPAGAKPGTEPGLPGADANPLDVLFPESNSVLPRRLGGNGSRRLSKTMASKGSRIPGPPPGTDGAVAHFLSVEDESDRKRMEEALAESEARFRGVFENAATGISIADLGGGCVSCNPAYAAM